MIVLGLTGSIGMGKSTAAAMLRRLGCPVHDSDAAVHRLYARGGAAVPVVAALFPDAVRNGAVDRAALSAHVVGRPEALRRLEAAVHPLVRADADRFLRRAARRKARVAVLDIPLLFESRGEGRVDRIAVVSAPASVQRARVLARPGMTPAKLAAILALQMPDREKRRRADFVVPTGLGRRHTLIALTRIVRVLGMERGRIWPPRGYRPPAPSRGVRPPRTPGRT
ncbi:dephospho-CoA kinase [Rhodospirillum centenum]|uniref:Dephospho-CoA kinase n=1 Tax=Rhodospirillum centenum (strain ATCC 51521 / SW) TaxID=414684 RepID=B6IV50_RHOCS|nr:dephospho-CoA kinase [Rhodospirillum centenum]ACJ00174.1 dephospho-CoA kinase [Rhodospirillum centenum SW]